MTQFTYMETQNTCSTLLTREAGKGFLVEIILALVNTEKNPSSRGYEIEIKCLFFPPRPHRGILSLWSKVCSDMCFQSH